MSINAEERKEPLIRAVDLRKEFVSRRGIKKSVTRAVDGVSFELYKGETLGLVGESGCGKSTLGRLVLRLSEPDSGRIIYDGKDITDADMAPYRRELQIVFQDPGGSLDPKMSVGGIVAEGLELHKIGSSKAERREMAAAQLLQVGLGPECLDRHPGSFSGGQQQRIAIARALAVSPRVLVCDEPVSSLDVSYQAQILNLLSELQQKLGLTYLFISHDLAVVRRLSDRIAVMYLGKIVETGPAEELCKAPVHPYTRALLAAVPVPDPDHSQDDEELSELSVSQSGEGCAFAPRCPYAQDRCRKEVPRLAQVSENRFCSCFVFADRA